MGRGHTKRLTAVLTAAGLTCVGLAAGVVPAFAAPITSQPYLDTVGITQLHAQGLDGTGVKIALIDGPVDTSVPELQGVTVVKKAFCDVDYAPATIAHATEIASILASPGYGWAPKATILNYARPVDADVPAGETWGSAWSGCGQSDTIGYQVEQALNDGADVISISIAGSDSVMTFPLVRAALKGVPVVMAAGNDATPYIDVTANANTVVAVGAIDQTGQRASYSNWGAGLSVMAYGGPVTGRGPDGSGALSLIAANTQGTSYAAPMVAGALALAKQKWPDANGNQLVRVMFDTIDGVADHQSNQTLDMGFGVLNAPAMVATDPAGYSTDNVLAQKNPDGHPTAEEFTAYRDGTADPYNFSTDNDYIYKGCDPMVLNNMPAGMKVEPSTAPDCQTSPSPTPQPTQTPTPDTPAATGVPWIVIGAGVIVVALIIVVGVVLLRRPAGKHRPPGPPVPPPAVPPPTVPPGWQQPVWQQPAPAMPPQAPPPWPDAPYPVPARPYPPPAQPPQYPPIPPAGL